MELKMSPWLGDGYEISLGQWGHGALTIQFARTIIHDMLAYMPMTAASFTIEQADLSAFEEKGDEIRPACSIVVCDTLVTQFGTAHGMAMALWMESAWDRQTYYLKNILYKDHFMARSDWHYGTEWLMPAVVKPSPAHTPQLARCIELTTRVRSRCRLVYAGTKRGWRGRRRSRSKSGPS